MDFLRLKDGLLGAEAAEVAFADHRVKMSVRAFTVREGVDRLFEVLVTAACSDAELDLARVAGRGASFRLFTADPQRPHRAWSGVCREIEQISVEESGLSIYLLHIAPLLWRTTQRVGRRIFQHQSAVDIAKAVLGEWGIEPKLRLEHAELPRHEYRVQLDESDFAFVTRQLEEAGVSYWFEQGRTKHDHDKELENMQLVLGVEPNKGACRAAQLPFRGASGHADDRPYVCDVRFGRAVRPGRFSLRGFDFRSSRELALLAEAQVQHDLEERYEIYRFAPEAFLAEHRSGHGDELDERAGKAAAQVGLERARSGQRTVRFRTNLLDLEPGAVISLAGHPRAELCHPGQLFVSGAELSGEIGGEWRIEVEAVPAKDGWRAALKSPKPRVMGLQSALVVGEGAGHEEIHTDEHGRVKVQFHWDRHGKHDERSSCWLRVSQSWAGSGYGTVQLPRVGHEVLVDFFEGDPDQPLVVGRAYNRTARVPYSLPQHKTKTVWRSCSTPGGHGYNELSFEDAAGHEVVHLRAQRDFELNALGDARHTIGKDLTSTVAGSHSSSVKKDEKHEVGGNRKVEVSGDQAIHVKGKHSQQFDGGCETRSGAMSGICMQDGKLVITNGQASIVLDGPIVRIDAMSNIWLRSDRMVTVSSKKVYIDKDTAIDKHDRTPPVIEQLAAGAAAAAPAAPAHDGPAQHTHTPTPPAAGGGGHRAPGGLGEAAFDSHKFYEDLLGHAGVKVKLPKNLPLPGPINEQLERYARVAHKSGVARGELLDPKTYEAMKTRVAGRLEGEKARLAKLGSDVQKICDKHRDHTEALAKHLGARVDEEKKHLDKLGKDLGDVFHGKKGNLVQSAKALGSVLQEQRGQLMALRQDVLATIEKEKSYFKHAVAEAKGKVDEVKHHLHELEQLVKHPKDALLDAVLGPDKKLGKDIVAIADEFGHGKEVADALGIDMGPAGHTHVPVPPDGGAASHHHVPVPPGGDAASHTHTPTPPALKHAPATFDSKQVSIAAAKQTPKSVELSSRQAGHVAANHAGPGLGQGGAGQVVARSGGLASRDVAATVNPSSVGFLQSPSEGQLMVVPTAGAKPIDEALLTAKMVDAQMAGRPAVSAMNDVLAESGYAVYQRSYGDWAGSFVQAAETAHHAAG